MNTPIRHLMNRRPFAPVTVAPDCTILDAVLEMNNHAMGSVLVMDQGQMVGIFTERDVLTRVVAKGVDAATCPVSAVMTPNPITLSPDATLRDALEVFDRKHFRHLPIADDSGIVGLISIRDVSAWLVHAHREEAQRLLQYITGGYPA